MVIVLSRAVLLSLPVLLAASCGGTSTGASAPGGSDDGLPDRIGEEDCGGCEKSATHGCAAYFQTEGEDGEGKYVPCAESCCRTPSAVSR